MAKIPISMIIDDSGPVNIAPFYFLDAPHEAKIPHSFTKEFARICRDHNIMGKFSVLPMPACLGRVDQNLNGFSPAYVRKHLQIIREEIAPAFSITPELLTHNRAYNPRSKTYRHVFEDVFVAQASAEEIADYIAFALEILSNVGLNPTGVTSPWGTGLTNEENYAKGIGMAFRKVMNKNECFYFLHNRDDGWKEPKVMVDTPECGKVVTVPNQMPDAFRFSQNPHTARQAKKNVKEQIDSVLSPDGRSGVMREIFEEGSPLVFITHWQNLFSDGRCIGLEALEVLAERINKVFKDQIEWMPMAELAKRWTSK